MKHEIDKHLHVKQHTLKIGDLFIYEPPASKIHNKLQPKRSLTPYTITAIRGSAITAQSNNHTITRNCSHFKPFHHPLDMSIISSTPTLSIASTHRPTTSLTTQPVTTPPNHQQTTLLPPTTPIIRRASSRITRPPQRLQISSNIGESY